MSSPFLFNIMVENLDIYKKPLEIGDRVAFTKIQWGDIEIGIIVHQKCGHVSIVAEYNIENYLQESPEIVDGYYFSKLSQKVVRIFSIPANYVLKL